jgi:hypothetical protein
VNSHPTATGDLQPSGDREALTAILVATRTATSEERWLASVKLGSVLRGGCTSKQARHPDVNQPCGQKPSIWRLVYCPTDNKLVNAQIRLAVIEAGMAKNGLYGLNVACRGQQLCRE